MELGVRGSFSRNSERRGNLGRLSSGEPLLELCSSNDIGYLRLYASSDFAPATCPSLLEVGDLARPKHRACTKTLNADRCVLFQNV